MVTFNTRYITYDAIKLLCMYVTKLEDGVKFNFAINVAVTIPMDCSRMRLGAL